MGRTRRDARTLRAPRAFVVLLVCGLALALTGCDWMSFGFDAGNSRYNNTDKTITVANVGNLAPAFAGITGGAVESSPAVANNVAYVGSRDGYLYAFDARGITGCNASLKRCDPLWTANLHNIYPGDPTVANGIVYIVTPGGLYAFDAAGSTGCSGTPKTCTPLWQASFGSGGTGNPVVVNGVLYLEKYGALYAFDAAGSTGCSGSPKVCSPLWTGSAGGANVAKTVAVVNGVAYVPAGNIAGVYAFDAAGSNGCSGSPKTCVPLWRASKGGTSATVVGGRLYSQDQYGLYAFDAAGATPCQGIPKVCAPLWTYSIGGTFYGVPAVANGTIYVGHSTSGSQVLLSAFDAAGSSGCSGTPKVCSPLWQSSTLSYLGNPSSPAVANGVAFVGSRDGNVYAFDAAGSSGCTGTPKVCSPLWSSPTNSQVNSSPAIANGAVFVGSSDKSLYVFK
jgi:outer membrane protein assembly factor BamB